MKTQYQIHRRSRPPSTESYNDEIIGYSDMENDSRFLSTPAGIIVNFLLMTSDARNKMVDVHHDLLRMILKHKLIIFAQILNRSIILVLASLLARQIGLVRLNRYLNLIFFWQHHPPSPRTNHSFLFKREPPDGAEVVPLLNDSNSKDDFRDIISTAFFETSILPHIEMKDSPVMIENQSTNMVKHENTFTPRYFLKY